MKICFAIAATLLLALFTLPARADQVSGFEDVTLGMDGSYTAYPSFSSGGVVYGGRPNSFSDGFAASNHTDTADYGDFAYQHPYDAITGGGSGSTKYGVANAFFSATATLTGDPLSIDVTNTTYAYYSMLNGDGFAKQFGGPSGDDPDYFLLTISGYDASNDPVGSVPFYLADYRFAVNDLVADWREVDLSSLVGARTLVFSLTSTDNGEFGMNTPAFFAADNLVYASSFVLGDMNGDDALDNFDIGPFEMALTNPSTYLTAYPTLTDYATRGDINADESFDNFDIGPFESLVIGGPATAVPEPSTACLALVGLALAGWRLRRARVQPADSAGASRRA